MVCLVVWLVLIILQAGWICFRARKVSDLLRDYPAPFPCLEGKLAERGGEGELTPLPSPPPPQGRFMQAKFLLPLKLPLEFFSRLKMSTSKKVSIFCLVYFTNGTIYR